MGEKIMSTEKINDYNVSENIKVDEETSADKKQDLLSSH